MAPKQPSFHYLAEVEGLPHSYKYLLSKKNMAKFMKSFQNDPFVLSVKLTKQIGSIPKAKI